VADRLAELVETDPRLELWRQPITGVVNWRPRTSDTAQVRNGLEDAWISTAHIDGEPWLRSVAANPCSDPQRVVRAVLGALDRSP